MVEKRIILAFQDGHQCAHHPTVKSENEWWEFVEKISIEMSKRVSSLTISPSAP